MLHCTIHNIWQRPVAAKPYIINHYLRLPSATYRTVEARVWLCASVHLLLFPPVPPPTCSSTNLFIRPPVPPPASSPSHLFLLQAVHLPSWSSSHPFLRPPLLPPTPSSSNLFLRWGADDSRRSSSSSIRFVTPTTTILTPAARSRSASGSGRLVSGLDRPSVMIMITLSACGRSPWRDVKTSRDASTSAACVFVRCARL